jgi:hypothetical protein
LCFRRLGQVGVTARSFWDLCPNILGNQRPGSNRKKKKKKLSENTARPNPRKKGMTVMSQWAGV